MQTTSIRQRSLSALVLLLLLTACSDSTGPVLFAKNNTPVQLSQWQLMKVNGSYLELNSEVVAYDLATPLFSDYALKLRTVWLPAGSSAGYTDTGSLDFPVGTIISKTFYYPVVEGHDSPAAVLRTEQSLAGFSQGQLDLDAVRLIETRLLVHQADGWQALPYVWNETQTDATLEITGAVKRLQLHQSDTVSGEPENFAYVVPNRNECASCHVLDQNKGDLSPIGPSARNLNRLFAHYPTGAANQLEAWEERGWLGDLPPRGQRPIAALWEPGKTDNLENRARTYLDVNCGHCHQPGGSGDTSGLFLHAAETSALALGVCKPPVAAGRGSGGNSYSIVPGHPEQSILSFRISSDEVGVLMPEVGRSLTHEQGSQLINEWIRQQSGDCS